MNHLLVPTCHRLTMTVLLAAVIVGQGIAHSQESESIHIVMPPELPTSATRCITFELSNTDSWLNELDREAIDVSQVDEVIVFYEVNQELMEFVASFPRTRIVSIILDQPNENFNHVMAPLAEMKKLECLDLNIARVNPCDCAFLANLHSLTEFRCTLFLFKSDFNSLGSLPALTSLNIGHVVEQPGAEKQPKKQFLNLLELTLGLPQLLKYFESSAKLQKLLVSDPVTETDVKLISRFKELKEITLTVSNLEVLQPLNELKNLTTLNVTIRQNVKAVPVKSGKAHGSRSERNRKNSTKTK